MFKKFILSAVITVSLFSGVAAFAAVGEMQGQLQAAAEQGAGFAAAQDPRLAISTIIRTALSVIGMVFLVLTIYAGALWMTAGGNEEQITKAKNIIKASVIGLIIIFSAYSITYFVTWMAMGGRNNTVPVGTSPGAGQPFTP
ncbi:MAG: pilin [Patescibacteria group bacterium]|nr:pilin [Patescibacteria group bacterium]